MRALIFAAATAVATNAYAQDISRPNVVVLMTDNQGYGDLGVYGGADVPTDRPIDGFDQTAFLLGETDSSARDHRLVFYQGHFAAIRWKHYKAHFVTWDRYKSLSSAPQDYGQIPQVFNLYGDPKELIDIFGTQGGTPLFQPMGAQTAQYLQSFQEHPNNGYANIERDR